MKKIMFNDRYGLTQAVLEGRKTMKRRELRGAPLLPTDTIEDVGLIGDEIQVIANGGESLISLRTRYKLCETVAIAQSYKDIIDELEDTKSATCAEHYVWNRGLANQYIGLTDHPGFINKMFTRADLMTHQIRITGIRIERLHDISDEDCFKEGINASNSHEIGYGIPWVYGFEGSKMVYDTPREAFAALIDKVSGRGTWDKNPYVVVYEFELVE